MTGGTEMALRDMLVRIDDSAAGKGGLNWRSGESS
jgi:hypothetical protein